MNDKKEVNRLDGSSKVLEGTDKIAIRKMMNKWLSEARSVTKYSYKIRITLLI